MSATTNCGAPGSVCTVTCPSGQINVSGTANISLDLPIQPFVTAGQYAVMAGTVNARGIITEVHEASIGPALGLANKGDLATNDGSGVEILPVGTDGMVLMADSAQSSGLVYDFVDHNDLLNKGTNSHADIDAHIANTSNPHNVTIAQVSPLTTKGDVLAYGSSSTRLPIGTDGQLLTADSTQTLGMAWKTPKSDIYLAARTPTTVTSNILNGWTTVAKDSASTFNGQTFTVPAGGAGQYRIAAQIPITSTGASTTINLQLSAYVNGSAITHGHSIFPTYGQPYIQTMTAFRQINLSDGDQVDIRLFNLASPLSLSSAGGSTLAGHLSIYRIA